MSKHESPPMTAPTPSGGANDASALTAFAIGCRRQAEYYRQRDSSEAPWFDELAELLTRTSAALLAARRGEQEAHSHLRVLAAHARGEATDAIALNKAMRAALAATPEEK